jgi:lysophospholipid acyltransferase (LPLAT)-like uncharacterized protein
MVRAIRDLRLDGAFAVDGPRGPLHEVQPGALSCARHAQGLVIPIGSAAAPAKTLLRAWDRMVLPFPFARAVVVVGPALPADTSPAEIAAAIDATNVLATRELDKLRSARRPDDPEPAVP